MSTRSNSKIPRDIQDGIRDVMDKRVKVSLKLLVKMETRGDKTENKVLAFSPCRLFVLNAKVPSKLEHSFHFLDIQSIESRKPHQLALTVDGKVYVFQALETNTDEIDHIITHIGISMKQIFPSFPLERLIAQIDVQPVERLRVMNDLIKAMEGKTPGPCGGYTTMYQCMCDYHAMPFREEVEWDVDTIYLSLDSREFRLQDFDHLMARDLVPIIGALEHNAWFKSLNASNVKLSVEACSELIRVMKRNAVIEEINLSNTGIRSDFLQKFALALISNSGTQLSRLDISNNLLEDRGINHLLGALKHLPCGLSSFDMSRTGVSTKCLNKVGEVLAQSPNIMASLSTLKLNDNGLKGEDFPLLYNCLAQPNVITYLDLSSTDCALDTLSDPLLRGCPNLTTLRASGTTFSHKRSKVQVPLSWKQFFNSSCYLEFVDLSNCRLPPEALKELLLGLSANRNVKGVYINVSSNELGPAGASLIAPCLPELTGVTGLDISNNGFDVEIKTLLTELAKNHHIKQLSLGRNFVNIKPKFRPDVMSALTLLLQEENSGLESLSLADSKLKGETAYIINALGSNETLLEIDISGNSIGDLGARMLAKALMINNKIKRVVWDKNNVSAQGFEDVAEALQKNLALKKMPYPVNDAAAALRLYPERTEIALQKIESCLQRNHSPRRFAPDQAYRLQQGFLISSTQQMVDRLVVNVEDTVNALLKTSSAETHAQEVVLAQKLVADANNSRQLLPSLQDIALKSQAAGNQVDTQLQTMTESLTKAIEEQLEKTKEEMLKCTSSHCPAIMGDQTFHDMILEGCQSKSALPKDFATGVLETASTDIYNTTSEMNLAVANLISDNVIEGVIESLSTSLKSLTTHLNIRKSSLLQDDEKEEDDMDRLRFPAENSPKLTNKRMSVLNRKTRPQSTMGDGSAVQDMPKAPPAENHVVTKVKESSAASSRSGSSEQLAELPDLPTMTATSKPLEHVTKARPRRPKAHRPTRPVVNTGTTEMEDGMGNILESPAPIAVSSSSPKAPERKDHKSKKEKEESPSSAKSKQEEGASGKTEGKRWMPSFMKKKEDKPKKKSSLSSSFSLFKKKGSEDRKRPSLTNDDTAESDASNSSNIHAENGERPVETASETIKESAKETSEVAITVNNPPTEEETAAAPNKSPGPVAPRRMLPPDRPAFLPPVGKKSPETKRSSDAGAKSEEKETTSADDQKKGTSEETKQESSTSQQEEKEKEPEEVAEEKRPKLPPGVAQMPGLGALGGKSLLQEMELKQKKRMSHKPVSPGEEQKEMVAPTVKPSSETNNNVQNQASEKAAPASPTLKPSPKPTPKTTTDTPAASSTVTSPSASTALASAEEVAADTPEVTSPSASSASASASVTSTTPTETSTDAAPSTASTSTPAVNSTPTTTPTTTTTTSPTPPTKGPPERPSRPSRPPSSAVSTAAVDASKKGDGAPPIITSEPTASPAKHPVPPAKPPLPSPAPRPLAASRRPTSVVEAPGAATADLPSSMTTSTPEFHLDGSHSSDSHAPPRPAIPPKARPPIMPRPKKRDSAPVEESSDIQAQSPLTTPTVPTSTTTPITSPSTSDEPANPFFTNRTVAPTLPPPPPDPTDNNSPGSNWNKSASVTHKLNTETQSQSQVPDPTPSSPPSLPLESDFHRKSQEQQPSPSSQEECSAAEPDANATASGPETSAPEEGIVYDSATLRMSVKDKIKRLGRAAQSVADPPKGAALTNSLRPKAMSLPKDARLPGSPTSDST
ncbi:hypothetical protein EGW08_010826 [Elysia chlorotica]|uniref:CARMIL pleckstrin homology domain-containing protein n=1 Tax=Elysia chlorotica TaxID=188477 RepID=A0A433TIH4_ELYCH|nr:hypothetical protein EGW08_010826 [Elysia chlorotica]